MTITLSGVRTDGTKFTVNTKQILNVLSNSIGTTLTSKARLIVRSSTIADGSPTVVVRDVVDKQNVDYDVSGVIVLQPDPDPFTTHVTVTSTKGAVTSKTETFILRVSANAGNNPSFIVQGYTTAKSDDKGSPGVTTLTSAKGSVSGVGTDANGTGAVVQGTISLSGRKIED